MKNLKMERITIKTIPHNKQKYPTVGDWRFMPDELVITVSEMRNSDYEFLVGIHEAIEAYLCVKSGIEESAVNEFDEIYEELRRCEVSENVCGCRITKTSEPGNDKHSPYYFKHRFATEIEKMIAKKLKVNWRLYEKKVNSL
jgi:hypothetical protein